MWVNRLAFVRRLTSHPISTARHTSLIRSPACLPTRPPPISWQQRDRPRVRRDAVEPTAPGGRLVAGDDVLADISCMAIRREGQVQGNEI